MSGRTLLYGASGYTGRELAARLAGQEIVLAGRSADKVRAIAEPLGLPWRTFDLSDPARLDEALCDVDLVLHAAGPFDQTGRPMREACLRARVHYLDLSGEWPGFADAMAQDAQARTAGVMLMPGVGLTIAASDCLLATAKSRWPDTVKLRLGVSRAQVITRGTVASAARLFSPKVLVRRGGELCTVPAGSLAQAFDFGDGLRQTTAMSWADVVTATFTTGVGDVEVYSELPPGQRAGYRAAGLVMGVTGVRAWRTLGAALAAAWPEGPAPAIRERASFTMVVEALDAWRRPRRLRMRTLDGYSASVATAAAAVERVRAGQWSPGFQTPGRIFGPDFAFAAGAAVLETPWLDRKGAAA
jgi:short subunit dehydrogenase-like uncharacterized protein